MADLLVQNDGVSWIMHSGGYGIILRIAGSFSMPLALQLADRQMVPRRPFEKETVMFACNIVDEDETQVPLATIEAITLEVFEQATEEVLRPAESVLNVNDVTIAEDSNNTVLTWIAQVEDTKLTSIANESENHLALFQTAWDSGSNGSLTDPLSMTDTSATVRVTLASHGLVSTEEHHVFFEGSTSVGGLLIVGAFAITAIIDVDTFDIDARCAATSTATGGGTVNYWLNPKTSRALVTIPIERVERVCA